MRVFLHAGTVARRLLPLIVVAVAIALLPSHAAAAQDGVLAGKVTDPQGKPVPGARIVVISPARGDQRELKADDDGKYMGRGFRPESYLVRVEADGYQATEQQVRVRLGMNTVDFVLAPGNPHPNVDYEGLNKLYDEGFKAYQAATASGADADWSAAESKTAELLDGLQDLEGEDVETMRQSALEILGISQLSLNKMDDAIATFQSIVDADPDSLTGRTWLGQAYARKGDFENAAVHMRRAAELGPDNPEVQYNAGAILLQVGDVEAGIAAMERAIELRPEFPVARKNLGYAYLRTQEYDKAIEMLESYLEQAPDAPDHADVEQMIEALRAQVQQQQQP